jgi:hypothetical protein
VGQALPPAKCESVSKSPHRLSACPEPLPALRLLGSTVLGDYRRSVPVIRSLLRSRFQFRTRRVQMLTEPRPSGSVRREAASPKSVKRSSGPMGVKIKALGQNSDAGRRWVVRPPLCLQWTSCPRRRIADGRIWRNFGAVVKRPSPAAAEPLLRDDKTVHSWRHTRSPVGQFPISRLSGPRDSNSWATGRYTGC